MANRYAYCRAIPFVRMDPGGFQGLRGAGAGVINLLKVQLEAALAEWRRAQNLNNAGKASQDRGRLEAMAGIAAGMPDLVGIGEADESAGSAMIFAGERLEQDADAKLAPINAALIANAELSTPLPKVGP